FSFLLSPLPPLSPPFPYTTLFRSLEPVYRFRRNFALQLLPARKAKSQELPLLRFRHRTFRLVHLELQLFRDESKSAVAKPQERRSEEHTSELQSPDHLVCRLLLEK